MGVNDKNRSIIAIGRSRRMPVKRAESASETDLGLGGQPLLLAENQYTVIKKRPVDPIEEFTIDLRSEVYAKYLSTDHGRKRRHSHTQMVTHRLDLAQFSGCCGFRCTPAIIE